ncbi:FAD-dependent monooxygenase [Actinoallomurus sp. WRP9H-5]|nr:FAD-dependent monooxygenase [Actinoallomurus rhizosphaericola]
MDQTADHATVRIGDRATGGTRTLQAAYIVGADGAGSFLRPYVTDDVEDLHGTQRLLIVDIHPFAHPAELPATNGFIVCEADKPVTYCPIFPPKLRFEFMLGDGDDAEEYERPTTVYRLLSRWLAPGDYRMQRTDVYEWHARLAGRWRNGRLFIAGDAAHEMPPMLGQGMCSGLRDAANLAWKLARVVTGRSGPDRTRGAWADLDVAVVTLPSPHLAAWLRDHEADAAIIRPDRYTYALTRGSAALDAATLALHERLAGAEVSA